MLNAGVYRQPRIMVHVVAYNAEATLAKVLDRIPAELRPHLTEVCVFDDASQDSTFLVGTDYKATHEWPTLQIHRNAINRGYGGNQKLGYRHAIDHAFDVVVLLHGDGQYAPEEMSRLIQPILDGEADAVFGSRMIDKRGALRGGMPFYKWIGNQILTRFENAALGMELTEFHSGYRAYSVKALAQIPFEANSDEFHFDTQIIIQLKAGGFRIKEVPIPTYYGDEISYVNGFKYAKDVVTSVLDFRRHEAGLEHRAEYAHSPMAKYTEKHSPFSSHHRLVEAVRAGTRVLDVGCAGGYIARALRARGCTVVGVDAHEDAAAEAACDRFYVTNLDGGDWAPEERDFDYILYGDVLEHLRDTSLLARSAAWLAPHGRIVASTGNVALWFMRLSLLLGRFQYAPRGILDQTHVRLYTRQTFRALMESSGLRVVHEDSTVIPLEQLFARAEQARIGGILEQAEYALARLWPSLFAYQIILQAEKA
ncbi:MAG: putative glycosyltransferase/methyltransferase [bacterium]|nr:putative glycosyltransferase/methyltransferase [bacterium]